LQQFIQCQTAVDPQKTSVFAKPGNETDREQTIYTKKSKKTQQ